MKRKVVLHGLSTLTLSIPSGWAKKNGIKKGDELDVEERGNGLVVKSSGTSEMKSKELDVSNLRPLIKRTLIKLYQEGYDEIRLKFSDPSLVKDAREVLNTELAGWEIIEQGADFCVIKNVSRILDDNFQVLVKRLFIMLEGMFQDGLRAIKQKDKSLLKAVSSREIETDRLSNFCLRSLNLGGGGSESFKDYVTVFNCERLGDYYVEFVNYLIEKKMKVKRIEKFHEDMNAMFAKIYDFVFNPSEKLAREIALALERFKTSIREEFLKADEETPGLSLIKEMVETMVMLQDIRLPEVINEKNS